MSVKQRSLGAPSQGIAAAYPSNDARPAAPRVLPGSMVAGLCEIREGRVWISARLGESKFMEISFTPAEFRALGPQLRAAFAALKETP